MKINRENSVLVALAILLSAGISVTNVYADTNVSVATTSQVEASISHAGQVNTWAAYQETLTQIYTLPATQQDKYAAQISTPFSKLFTDEIRSFIDRTNTFAKDKDADLQKLTNLVKSINESTLPDYDKGYFKGQMDSWGSQKVYTPEVQAAIAAIGRVWTEKTPASLVLAKAAIASSTIPSGSKEFLIAQLAPAEKVVTYKGYVENKMDPLIDLNVRATPNGTIIGHMYKYEKVEILDAVIESGNNIWDKIMYKNSIAYVSNAYIQPYTSPEDSIVNIAKSITKQFEVGTGNQIAGNFDGAGLSLGYFQWNIGQKTLQPLLIRMDREYNDEMMTIFGVNYNSIHNMLLDPNSQFDWAKSINDSTNNIIEPWNSQFVSLCNNKDFISIEADAEVYTVNQAMILICDRYNLKTVRGFALALDIITQNGSISTAAANIIDTAINQNPNMSEKSKLGIIANAVASTAFSGSEDIRLRKTAIVNGQGNVHGSMLYLDTNYGLSDNTWR